MSIINVIKYEVNPDEIVGKYQSDNIKLGSQLIVYTAQTAFFVRGGKIFDEFTSGTHTLQSDNLPLFSSFINLPFGQTPFAAEVWFVNQTEILDCKWGTSTPIQIEDPKYKVIVPMRTYGQYGIKITNPRRFLEKLVGNMSSFSTVRMQEYFRGVILSNMTNILAEMMGQNGLTVITVNAHVNDISAYARTRLKEIFAEYGIELLMFNVISITVKEDDPSFVRLKETIDAKAKINILGKEDFQITQSFGVLQSAAENGGGAMGAAVGLGAGVGIGGQMSGLIQNFNLNPDTPPPLPTTRYYLGINGQSQGPFDFKTVAAKIENGEIEASSLCWKKPNKEWLPLESFDEFSSYFSNECPPPLPTL